MGDQGCYICRSIIYIDFISFMFIISVEVMIFNSKCLLINLDIGKGNCMNNLDD